jgi:LPXTG-motif cell wall-anchored protein
LRIKRRVLSFLALIIFVIAGLCIYLKSTSPISAEGGLNLQQDFLIYKETASTNLQTARFYQPMASGYRSLAGAGLQITTTNSGWTELPGASGEPFDGILGAVNKYNSSKGSYMFTFKPQASDVIEIRYNGAGEINGQKVDITVKFYDFNMTNTRTDTGVGIEIAKNLFNGYTFWNIREFTQEWVFFKAGTDTPLGVTNNSYITMNSLNQYEYVKPLSNLTNPSYDTATNISYVTSDVTSQSVYRGMNENFADQLGADTFTRNSVQFQIQQGAPFFVLRVGTDKRIGTTPGTSEAWNAPSSGTIRMPTPKTPSKRVSDNDQSLVSENTLSTMTESFKYTLYQPTHSLGNELLTYYSAFEFTDTIDPALTLNRSGIKVYNTANQDLTNYFSISGTGNNLKMVANANLLNSLNLYNTVIRIEIPVTVNQTYYTANKSRYVNGKIPNIGTFKVNDNNTNTNQVLTLPPKSAFNSFELKKVDATNTSLGLNGAEFIIYLADNNWKKQLTSGNLTTVGGKITFSSDRFSEFTNYILYESKAPSGYQKNPTEYRITVSKIGTVTVLNGDSYISASNVNSSGVISITMKNEKRVPKLELTKVDETNTSTLLNGARFYLYNADDSWKAVSTFGTKITESGKITWNLGSGKKFLLKEVAPPNGYKANATIYRISVSDTGVVSILNGDSYISSQNDDGTGLIKVTVKNRRNIYNIRAIKKNSFGASLEGARFQLYSVVDGIEKALGLHATNAEGKLTDINLGPGTYRIQETLAPSGYALNNKKYEFTISTVGKITFSNSDSYVSEITDANSNNVISFTMKNQRDKYHIKLTKTDLNGTKLAGASFKLADRSSGDNVWIGTHTIGSDGTVQINNLAPREYALQETSAPTGYKLNNKIYIFTIKEDGSVVFDNADEYIGETKNTDVNGVIGITVKNEEKVFNIQVIKQEPSGTGLSGAKFQMYSVVDNVEKALGKHTTNAEGKITNINLGIGTYRIQETTAPTGYQLNNKKYEFTVTEDGNIRFTNGDSYVTGITNANSENIIRFTMKNNREKYHLKLTKTNMGNTKLAGASFKLADRSSGNNVWIGTHTIGSEGTVQINNLAPREYALQETNAPTGYKLNNKIYIFTIKEDGSVVFDNADEYIGETKNTDADGVIGITVKNEKNDYDLEITKIDKADPSKKLAGAEFVWYTHNGTNYVHTSVVKTDASGKIKILDLSPGKYKLYESTAPEGYQTPKGKFIEFEIKEDGKVVLLSSQDDVNATNANSNRVIGLTVKNKKIQELPKTGSIALSVVITLGLLCISIGFYYFYKKVEIENNYI